MLPKVAISVLFCLIITQLPSFGQKDTLYSNSADIHIIYNQSTKLNWHLQPEKSPDVFEIGSTLDKKSVKFISDIDSISFEIEAGQKINFPILLNGKTICQTQILALNNPFLIRHKLAWPTVIVLILLGLVVVLQKQKIKTNFLLAFGIISPILFWLKTIIGAIIHGNYLHIKHTISTLGEIGSESEVFMAIATLLVATFCLFFSIAFYNKSGELQINKIPALLSFSMPISMAWAAVFPAGHELHATLGPLPLVLLVGILVSFLLWKGEKYNSIRKVSMWSFAITLLFLSRFIPEFEQNYSGLVQRFFYLGWSVWFVGVAYFFSKN